MIIHCRPKVAQRLLGALDIGARLAHSTRNIRWRISRAKFCFLQEQIGELPAQRHEALLLLGDLLVDGQFADAGGWLRAAIVDRDWRMKHALRTRVVNGVIDRLVRCYIHITPAGDIAIYFWPFVHRFIPSHDIADLLDGVAAAKVHPTRLLHAAHIAMHIARNRCADLGVLANLLAVRPSRRSSRVGERGQLAFLRRKLFLQGKRASGIVANRAIAFLRPAISV